MLLLISSCPAAHALRRPGRVHSDVAIAVHAEAAAFRQRQRQLLAEQRFLAPCGAGRGGVHFGGGHGIFVSSRFSCGGVVRARVCVQNYVMRMPESPFLRLAPNRRFAFVHLGDDIDAWRVAPAIDDELVEAVASGNH